MEEKPRLIPKGIAWPFILLTVLFFAWAVPNNMTDTMLAAFKRIMHLTDAKTAYIQVVCYFLGYGCFAIPAALFIQKYTYKAGVMFGLGVYAIGALLFFPAMKVSLVNPNIGFYIYLVAIFVLFAGLSALETSTNSFVCALGDPRTATQRINLAQSFNPFGAITGVVVSQIFVLSQLNPMGAEERIALEQTDPEALAAIQAPEFHAITATYVTLGIVMLVILTAIALTKMPNLRETGKIDFKGSFGRLIKNKNYVWGVIAQFFNIGAQIAVWSYVIRYSMSALDFDGVIKPIRDSMLAAGASEEAITATVIEALRSIEPVAAGFYSVCDWIGLDALLPRTAEQAGATYYIMSLIFFVTMRFVCTFLMKYVKPRTLLAVIACIAIGCCIGTVYCGSSATGVYFLMCISGCMSLMFPTIYGMGTEGLGDDMKLGGSGMVMAIAGAALLTQVQGIISDQVGSIAKAYWVPAFAFAVIAFYAIVICRKQAKN